MSLEETNVSDLRLSVHCPLQLRYYVFYRCCAPTSASATPPATSSSNGTTVWNQPALQISKACLQHPNATDAGIQEPIVAFRADHPNWGPRPARIILRRSSRCCTWPAASTIGELMKSHGLVSPRRRRKACARPSCSDLASRRPNACLDSGFQGPVQAWQQ